MWGCDYGMDPVCNPVKFIDGRCTCLKVEAWSKSAILSGLIRFSMRCNFSWKVRIFYNTFVHCEPCYSFLVISCSREPS